MPLTRCVHNSYLPRVGCPHGCHDEIEYQPSIAVDVFLSTLAGLANGRDEAETKDEQGFNEIELSTMMALDHIKRDMKGQDEECEGA